MMENQNPHTSISEWDLADHPERLEDLHGKEQINSAINQLLSLLDSKLNDNLPDGNFPADTPRANYSADSDRYIRFLIKFIRGHELFRDIKVPGETFDYVMFFWKELESMSEKWEGIGDAVVPEAWQNLVGMLAAFDGAKVE